MTHIINFDYPLRNPSSKATVLVNYPGQLFSDARIQGAWDFDHGTFEGGLAVELFNLKTGGPSLTQTNPSLRPTVEFDPVLGRSTGRFTTTVKERLASTIAPVGAAASTIVIVAQPDALGQGSPQQIAAGFTQSAILRQAVGFGISNEAGGYAPQARAWVDGGSIVSEILNGRYVRLMAARPGLRTAPVLSVDGGPSGVGSSPIADFSATSNFGLSGGGTLPFGGKIVFAMLCNVNLFDPAQASLKTQIERFFNFAVR